MGCILCIIESISDFVKSVFLMAYTLIQMLLYNVYGIISVFCQMCSVLPLCIVFIITSKLKCLLCNNTSICCTGAQGNCPLLMSLVMILVLYFVFYMFGALDSIFSLLGYVKKSDNSTMLSGSRVVSTTIKYHTHHTHRTHHTIHRTTHHTTHKL